MKRTILTIKKNMVKTIACLAAALIVVTGATFLASTNAHAQDLAGAAGNAVGAVYTFDNFRDDVVKFFTQDIPNFFTGKSTSKETSNTPYVPTREDYAKHPGMFYYGDKWVPLSDVGIYDDWYEIEFDSNGHALPLEDQWDYYEEQLNYYLPEEFNGDVSWFHVDHDNPIYY